MKVVKLSLFLACVAFAITSCSDEALEHQKKEKDSNQNHSDIYSQTGEDDDDVILIKPVVVNAMGMRIPNVEVHVFNSTFYNTGITGLQDTLKVDVPQFGVYNYQLWQNGIIVKNDSMAVYDSLIQRLDTL